MTEHLLITIEDYKIHRLRFILNEVWKSRQSFTAINAARLMGNVLAYSQVCQWLRWSMHHLVEELKNLIRRNAKRLQRSKDFQEILGEDDERWLDPAGKQFAWFISHNRLFMSKVWHCTAKTYKSHAIREEIAYIDKQINKHFDGSFKWERPISHIVDREPDAKI